MAEFAPAPSVAPTVARRVLFSAVWVIGIPTAIVFLILLAAWLTEHVFLATDVSGIFNAISATGI